MDSTPIEDKKGFFQNDRMLVCGMLVFYGFCIIGLITATFRGLTRRNQTLSANATSTAVVVASQETSIAGTAIARLAEQDEYGYIERFDKVTGDWYVGAYEKQYGDLRIKIRDGFYIWDITDAKGFTQSTDFYMGKKVRNFDVYVDLKFVEDYITGAACSGLFFRKPTNDLNDGHYTFAICDDSRFEINFYRNNRLQNLAFIEHENAIKPSDWNRIEIIAREDHFTFIINNIEVFEMSDNRLKAGGLGLFIDVDKENPAVIWFDNFGYQSR